MGRARADARKIQTFMQSLGRAVKGPGRVFLGLFIRKCGPVEFWHYDFYAQALAKIERGHEQDRGDVRQMVASGRVDPGRLRMLFEAITGELIRYPALDRDAFAAKVEEALADVG